MATDKKELSVYKDGVKRPYFVKAENVNLGTKENPEFLPERLASMAEDIADLEEEIGGGGEGAVTGIKVGNVPYNPNTQGVVDLSEPFGDKVDKETGKALIPSTDLAKLQSLPTADQLTQQLETKADDAEVVKSISVNGGNAQTPVNGNVNIEVSGGSSVDPATATPSMDGTAAVGSSAKYAREDHVHPHDTTKVDVETGKSLMSADEHTKLAGLPTSSQLEDALDTLQGNITTLNNSLAPVAKSGSYNDLTGKPTLAPVATSGSYNDLSNKPAIPTVPQNIVQSVTVNGEKHTPDGNGDVNLGTISKGDKGDQGDTLLVDGNTDVISLIINDLSTGGAGNILSAEMGKRLKQNVDAVQANIVKLYNKLANMAFWNAADKAAAAPTPLDWSIPKETVTITNSIGADAVIKHNGTAVSGTLQVDQGDPLTLTIEAASGKVLTSVAATIDGVAATLTESGGVYTLAIAHVNADMTIVISGQSTTAYNITLNLTNCSKVSGPSTVLGGGSATLVFAADSDYNLPSAQPTVTGASVTSWSAATGELVIGSVTGDVTIAITASFAGWLTAPKNDTSTNYGFQQGRSIQSTYGYMTAAAMNSNTIPTTTAIPAAYPTTTKIFTMNYPGSNPGKETKNYFASEGKRYLNVKLELNSAEAADASGYDYKLAVGCFTSAVINNQQANDNLNMVTIDGWVYRVGFDVGNVTTYEWKIDLNTIATDNGKTAGSIAYVKLLIAKVVTGTTTNMDSRTWIDNATIKYKFTDD